MSRTANQETWTLNRLKRYGRVSDVQAFSDCKPRIRDLAGIVKKLRRKGFKMASVKQLHPGGWHVVYYLKSHHNFKRLKKPEIYHEN